MFQGSFFIILENYIFIYFYYHYSNLSNNRVGSFNHVGGRFLEINKRVGPNKAV